MIKTAAFAILLAACVDREPERYPTEEFHSWFVDGRRVVTYGAYAGDVCEAIADAACDSDRCQLEWFTRCNPIGGDGVIAAASLESWDAAWGRCLAQADRLVGFPGDTRLHACAVLTPFWHAAR